MADPTMDQAVQQVYGQLGTKGLTTDETTFITEELAADQARQVPGSQVSVPWQALSGASLMQMGSTEFHQVLTAAENFANNAGDNRFYPTQAQLQAAVQQGVDLTDPKSFEQYMQQYVPPSLQTKLPWLGTGLGKSGYEQTLQNFKQSWETYTGAPAEETDPTWLAHVNQLIAQGVSPSSYEQQIQNDPALQQQFGWLAHGYTYTQFQQYKNDPNNRQAVVAKFGVDGANSDTSYLTQLNTASNVTQQKGQAINTQSLRTQGNLTGMSSVR